MVLLKLRYHRRIMLPPPVSRSSGIPSLSSSISRMSGTPSLSESTLGSVDESLIVTLCDKEVMPAAPGIRDLRP